MAETKKISTRVLDFDRIDEAAAIERAAIEEKNKKFPALQQKAWSRDKISRYCRRGWVAEIDGKLAGYMIPRIRSNYISIEKLESSPEFAPQEREIKRQLLNKMLGKLDANQRTHLVFRVSTRDFDTVEFLKDSGFTPMCSWETGGNNGDMLVMSRAHPKARHDKLYLEDLEPIFPGKPAADQYDPNLHGRDEDDVVLCVPDTRQERGTPTLLHRARAKLAEITGMEWRFVVPDGEEFHSVEDPSKIKGDIYLQTVGGVMNPQKALDALSQFVGRRNTPKLHASKAGKMIPITIPANWIKEEDLDRGEPRELAEAFTPADAESRYRIWGKMEEILDKKRRGGGGMERE